MVHSLFEYPNLVLMEGAGVFLRWICLSAAPLFFLAFFLEK